jgi:transcriptional regulator
MGLIEGHFAKANRHWQALAGRETLVVFPGPHSYVSPANYTEPLSVPTWNYIAVHAYGTLELVEDEAGKDALLAGLIAANEPAFAEQWRPCPEGFGAPCWPGFRASAFPLRASKASSRSARTARRKSGANVRAAQAAGTPDERALAAWMARDG